MKVDSVQILVVEDQIGMRTTLVGNLEDQGHRVFACQNGIEVLQYVQQNPPDIVIADLRLPDLSGLQILETLKEVNPEAAFIVMTGHASVETAIQALNEGAFAYITKPFNPDYVNTLIRNAVRQQRLLRENERLVETLQQSNGQLNDEIAERRRLEDQLIQSQKMEAIGRLAGGIAHDFNNLLMPITGYSQIAIKSLPTGDRLRIQLEHIYDSAQRAATLVGQLLTFSRKQLVEMKVIDLGNLIADIDSMLRRVIGENIELSTSVESGLGSVKVDPSQFEQVLINLAVNARDAMPEGGKLIVAAENITVGGSVRSGQPDIADGEYVRVTVKDNGEGMSDIVKSRVFDPFFTTKEFGKGSGLGLSTCYGIIKENGGQIFVNSEVGQGTCFEFYLPRIGDPIETSTIDDNNHPLPLGSETILLVEDEMSVRETVSFVLKGQGYTVLEAANGADALQVVDDYSSGRIDLVLTDVLMPGMNARELADQLLVKLNDVKILYMSGYTDDVVIRQGVSNSSIALIQKPFTPIELAHKVRERLAND